MRKGILLLLAVLALVAAAGCGDDEAESATIRNLSNLDYAEWVNAICNRSGAEMSNALSDYWQQSEGSLREEVAGAAEEVTAPALEARLDEIREQGRPRSDFKGLTEFLTAMEKELDTFAEEEAEPSDNLATSFAATNKAARRAGLEACMLVG
jgi:hypothetical protein